MAGEPQEKSIIVTGASRGIGEAAARLFARQGARLTLAHRNVEKGEALASELTAAGAEEHFVPTDVASVAGHAVNPIGAVYCATKFGIRAIGEALRQEVKPDGLRTTILSPGAVDTELPRSVKAESVHESIADFY